MVHGSLELSLVVQPGQRKTVIIRHVHVGPRDTRHHISISREPEVEALSPFSWLVSSSRSHRRCRWTGQSGHLLRTTGWQIRRPQVLVWTVCMWKKYCAIQQVARQLGREPHWWKSCLSLLLMLTCIYGQKLMRLCSCNVQCWQPINPNPPWTPGATRLLYHPTLST